MQRAVGGCAVTRTPWQEKGGQEDNGRQESYEEEDQEDNQEKIEEKESCKEEVEKDNSEEEAERVRLLHSRREFAMTTKYPPRNNTNRLVVARAADVLLGGGVIAYPTEGVFGLGCLPDEPAAIRRILQIKQRDPGKGLILIAAARCQLETWVAEDDLARLPAPEPRQAVTWIVRPGRNATPLLQGHNRDIAVRITSHPTAAAICARIESPITSTSANLSGRPAVRNQACLHRCFRRLVDYIVPGDTGAAMGPSEIRILEDGRVIRPGKI